MTGYRDQWATLFNGGKGIQVIAISMDADTTQADWAKEASLPMTFASDVKGEAGKLYGAWSEGRTAESRLLYVVGPDGRIAWTAKPFKPMVAESYTELGVAVKKAAGLK
jgi:peroxiredoxin